MNNPSILLVDDNPENLMLLELVLGHENFTVRTASGALDALQSLALSVPDAMLTDVQMPDIDGLELVRRVRRDPRTARLCILAVSANGMKENIQAAYAAGCDGYITKPLDTRTFAATVREYLAQGRESGAARLESAPPGDEFLSGGEFLSDCRQKIEEMVSDRALRRAQACEVLRQWAGTAGVLGYPQISTGARSLESRSGALSEQEFVNDLCKLAEVLANLCSPAYDRKT